ncbi:MAG: ferrous iron transport protein A [Bryobacteraceae bacterium]|nr:ferrous iron transport protein A [Bryobacteraceae bacterium]
MISCHSLPLPLHLAGWGRFVRLHRVTGNSETQSRLAALGLIPGAELQLVGGSARGPLIVGLKSGRLMLGPELARHLWVE